MRITCQKLKSHDRLFREILMKHSIWRIFKCDFLTLHSYYIYPHYPKLYERPQREKNPKQVFNNTHLSFQKELLILSEIILVSSYSPSHCHTLRGDLYPNITHTFSECREYLGAWETLGICQKKPVMLGGYNRVYCGIQKAKEDMTPRSSLVAGVWKAQVHWVDQAQRVFCYLCTQILFSSGSIYLLKGSEKVFRRVLRFPLQ